MLTKAPLSRARTIVRTEAGRVQEQANFDAANKAKAAGADVVKQWSAVLDGKTRDTHRELDHQIREMDKPFEIGGKKAMYPHDFGDPAEDCNCRCTLLTRARAALDKDELAVMQKRAEFFGLDKSDSFAEFKEKYLKAAQTVENTGKSGIINYGEMASEEIAARYMKPDGTNLLSKEFSAMPVEIQREAVRGYDKAISMYGSISPQRIKAERMKNNVYALYSPLYKTITLNSSIPDALEEAYATVIHEMTHHAENIGLFKSDEILQAAFKRLALRGSSKQAANLKIRTIGSTDRREWENAHEIIAHAVDKHMTGKGNQLTEAIYEVLKEKGVIK